MALGDPTKTWGASQNGGGTGQGFTAGSGINRPSGNTGTTWVPTPSGQKPSQPWQTNPSSPNFQPPPPDYSGLFAQAAAYFQPERSQIDYDRAAAQAMGAFQGSYYDQRTGLANQNYGLDLKNNDLDMKGNGIQRANLEAMMRAYPGYFLNAAQVREQSIRGSDQQGKMERIGINSDATGKGAWFGPMRGIKNDDSSFRQQLSKDQAETSFSKNWMDLEKAQRGTQTDIDMLGVQAEKLGIDRQKLKVNLDQGLASLGYDRFMSTADLLQKMNSSNLQEAQLAREIYQRALDMGTANTSGLIGSLYGQFGG